MIFVQLSSTPSFYAYALACFGNFGHMKTSVTRLVFPNRHFFVMNSTYFTIPDCDSYCKLASGKYMDFTNYFYDGKFFISL